MRLLLIAILSSLVPCGTFAQSYTISTFAGGGLPVNIPGSSASLSALEGVAADAAGNIFFTSNNTVLRLDAQSRILTLVAGNGTRGFSGDNGPAVEAQLQNPSALAVDSDGNVYIADSDNLCVRKVENGIITTVAGNGTFGFSGDGGPAVSAQLSGPIGVAVDSAGNLYIADRNNQRVRMVSSGVITTIAGNGTRGFAGDGGSATGAQLSNPSGVAVDSAGSVYILDSGNLRIRKVKDGMITTIPGGFPGAGLSIPVFFAVDAAGNVFVTEANSNRVREISNGVITTIAGTGSTGFSGDGGPATSAQLNNPYGLAVDGNGNVYVADTYNVRLREISNGVITTAAGNGDAAFSGDGGPAASAQLSSPRGVAADAAGEVFVVDGSRIRMVSNGVIATVAGNGQPGFSGDNGPALNSQLFTPDGIAVDSAGELYIADYGNGRVRKVAGGVITTVAGEGTTRCATGPSIQLRRPRSVALDALGNLYISDTDDDCVLELSSGVVAAVVGNGFPGFSGDNGPAGDAQLGVPQGVAVDGSGNLYISDTGNGRIRKVSNGVITTVAGGATSIYSDDGLAIEVSLTPSAVALDASSVLYFVDGNRIRKISGGAVTTIAGQKNYGFAGDGGPATSALLNAPAGLAADSAGNVYISDYGNSRIRVLTPQGSPGSTQSVTRHAATNHGGSIAPQRLSPSPAPRN